MAGIKTRVMRNIMGYAKSSSDEENEEKFSNVNSEISDKPLSKYFYKVTNHQDLFNLSISYWKEYENGAKAFAFISEAESEITQKTILGIASYFDRNTFVRIGIICQSLKDSSYNELLEKTHDVEVDLGDSGILPFRIRRVNNIDFIDFSELCQIANNGSINFHYEVILQKMLTTYGLILWDAPSINFFKQNPVLCFPMTLQMSSMSIIVKEKKASIEKLKEIIEFFDRYGVRIKGFILDLEK